MRIIVLVLTCVVSSLSELSDQKKSKEGARGPVTRVSETKTGSYGQKYSIDHREYNGTEKNPTERNDDDINYTYPANVQLVPNIPVSPHTPRYTLVPVRKVSSTTPFSTDNYDFGPTVPPEFANEVSNIKIPHVGHPGYITDPPPLHDDDEEEHDYDHNEEDDDDFSDHDETNIDHYFHDDFFEPPEFKDHVKSLPYPRVPTAKKVHSRVVIKHRPEHRNPLVITNYPAYEMDDEHGGFQNHHAPIPEDLHQPSVHTRVKHSHQYPLGPIHSPPCKDNTPLRHYGPPQPVPTFRQFNHAPYVVYPQPPMPRVLPTQRSRVYVRYPRNYKTYYHHQAPTVAYKPRSKLRVMTQSFVYHPKEYYRQYRNPITMSSMPELRNVQSPTLSTKPKKKRKRKKSKSVKGGECKPKKIIKEIHFHHYDPELSAQLAPLEGINLKDAEDYENDIKVITKETEIDDDAKTDYDEQYKQEVEKEMEKQRKSKGSKKRLKRPSYYDESYNPNYDSGSSTEYIDYNVQTDSKSSTFLQNRAFDAHKSSAGLPVAPPNNNTATSYTSFQVPLEGGSYVRQETIKYHYNKPERSKEEAARIKVLTQQNTS